MTQSVQVLPKELRLSAPPTMPQARSYLFKQQSTMTLYDPGQTIQINIPRLQRSYLTKDSYLKFRLAVRFSDIFSYLDGETTKYGIAAQPCLDIGGAQTIFDKIEVFDYLGSTLLESTAGFGQLASCLTDLGYGLEDGSFHGTITEGHAAFPIIKDDLIKTPVTATFMKPGAQTHGYAFTCQAPSATTYEVENVNFVDFAIPLFSFLGVLSPKYAPLHNGFTINLTLNNLSNMLGYSLVEGWADVSEAANVAAAALVEAEKGNVVAEVSDVYLCCQVLELGPQAESMLLSSTMGQPLVVHTKAFRNFVGTVVQGTTNQRLDLNLNVASMTNILWFVRQGIVLNDIRMRSLSGRIRNNINKWYFQYGSSVLPQTSGIQAWTLRNEGDTAHRFYNGLASEAYIELMKSRHKWTDTTKHCGLNLYDYNRNHYTDSVNIVGARLNPSNKQEKTAFAAGLDLELVSGRSNDLICGLNTNGMNTSIFIETMPEGMSTNGRLDAYCEYDAFINISPGIATTVSF
jgi:hypothetical protein